MTGAGFVVVSTQPNRADAELLAGLLRSGGIAVVVESSQDAEYPSPAGGGFRVTVPADRAAQAQELLAGAEHVDPSDPTSTLDVGVPVDDDVRDYLAWRGDGSDDPETAEPLESPAATAAIATPELHARRLPLVPLLGLVAVVVALVVLLR